MGKTLVLYYSKHGTTKQYAEWIASELNGDICRLRDVRQDTLGNYDVIVIGSGLYAGSIKGLDIIRRNHDKLKGRKLAIFTCGLSDFSKAANVKVIAARIDAAIPENIRGDTKTFFLRGGINYERLNFIDRILMAFMKMECLREVKKEGDNASDDTKLFLATYGKIVDFTDRNSIMEIVEYCNGNTQKPELQED